VNQSGRSVTADTSDKLGCRASQSSVPRRVLGGLHHRYERKVLD